MVDHGHDLVVTPLGANPDCLAEVEKTMPALWLLYHPDRCERKTPDLGFLRNIGERLFALAFTDAAEQ